ncbi:hypothetical protein [Aquitalea aquatica]|uniref:Uncharacterized protein n=1 Tax=Aquitalea aquatica TaxID=3044273 RepID=A0A838Y3M5_9NEIS|nr:hypothetical protein [Aquitalea magnusonii]MBA4709933.1 hypothetical protein [Aquitalea magnusonii]
MKKLAFLLAAVASTSAWAANVMPPVQLGIEGYHETYHEMVDGSSFMTEKARMLGITMAIREDVNDKGDAFLLRGRYAWGSADYSSASGEFSDLSRKNFDFSLVYQHDFALSFTTLTPEFGIGYRRLDDHLEQSGWGGYERNSMYSYLLFGISSRNTLNADWMISPRIAYKYVISGSQESRLSDISSSCSNLNNRQKDGYGYEVNLSFDRKLSSGNYLSLAPYYRYWNIKDSDTSTAVCGNWIISGMEPRNTTKEVGMNLSYSF